jgi:hypothetical protein
MAIQDTVSSLARTFTFGDEQAVSHYLDRHPFLVPLLWEVDVKARQYIDVVSRLILEVVKDFESGSEEGDELFAMIPTTLSPEEALQRLWHLDEDWWLEASGRGRHRMCVNIKYV